MKKLLLLILITISFAIFFYPIPSNSTTIGSPGGKTGSPTDAASCTGCHYAGNGNGASISTNIPSSGYVPNQVYTITAEVNQIGINKFGFEITAEEENFGSIKTGSFLVTNSAETQFTNSSAAITHKAGGTSGNNSKTWSMNWEAPNTGTGSVTFYGSFIGANGDNQNTGDTYHTSTETVNEGAIGVPGCTDSLALNYNPLATSDDGSCIYLTGIMHIMSNQVLIYPNPAKGNMTISLPKFEIFDLSIYDIMGRLVLSEDKISQTFIISRNTFTKGSYILHLSHAKGLITKKLIIE